LTESNWGRYPSARIVSRCSRPECVASNQPWVPFVDPASGGQLISMPAATAILAALSSSVVRTRQDIQPRRGHQRTFRQHEYPFIRLSELGKWTHAGSELLEMIRESFQGLRRSSSSGCRRDHTAASPTASHPLGCHSAARPQRPGSEPRGRDQHKPSRFPAFWSVRRIR
jgi:hypothetical protein